MLEQKHQRFMHVVFDGVAGRFVEFADRLAADGFGFAKQQVVGVGEVSPRNQPMWMWSSLTRM